MTVLELVLQEIDERLARERREVSRGFCNTFEDYKEKCGTIKGLDAARTIIVDTWHKMPREERL